MRTIIGGWAIDDPHPGISLDDIPRLSDRVFSLFVRNGDPAIGTEGFAALSGAIVMLGGMEHHHANFLDEQRAILDGRSFRTNGMTHEAMAFLNRMGQFRYFIQSDFAKRAIKDSRAIAPTIERLMIFRNKYAAHRSLDKPQDEPLAVRITHQIAMTGALWLPRPNGRPIHFENDQVVDLAEHRRFLVRENYMALQMMDHKTGQAENFVFETDVPTVAAEAFEALKTIILHR